MNMGNESLINPFWIPTTPTPLEVARPFLDSSNFLIRMATIKDLFQLADILAMSFHSHRGILAWIYPLFRLGIYEDLRNRLRSSFDHYVCLVAQVQPLEECLPETIFPLEDVLVGTVEMTVRSRSPWLLTSFDYPYLSNLAVHPLYRRRGVAQQLLDHCEHQALEWGFSEIYLHVLENNHGARHLYYQLGYRLEQIDGHWSSLIFRRPRRFFLRKNLSLPLSPSSLS